MFINKSYINDREGITKAVEFAYERLKEDRIVYLEGKFDKYDAWDPSKRYLFSKNTVSYDGKGRINVYTLENTKEDLETFELNKYKHPNIVRIYLNPKVGTPENNYNILYIFPDFATFMIRQKMFMQKWKRNA